jgi:tetratricopeptide (TPR) repeat protein
MIVRFSLGLVCAALLLAQQPLDRAWQLTANGRPAEAIAILQRLVAVEPNNADARLLLGSLLMEQNKKTESIAQLTAAVRLRPKSDEAQNALGEAYTKFGDTADARVAFEKAVALKPTSGIAQSNLGQALLAAGDAKAAAQHLDQAIHLLGKTDDAADAHYLRAKLYTQDEDTQQAVTHLEQAVAIRPNFAAAWSDLGQARRTLQDDPGALAAFERAVASDPRDSVALYRLGAEYLRQDKPHLAVESLDKAYRLTPEDQSTLNALQTALRRDGNPEAADRIKKQLTDLLRDKDRVNQNHLAGVKLNNEGSDLEKAGNLPGALAKYREAARLYPEHAGIRTNYGVALLRLGEWTEGLEELHQALLNDPKNEHLRAVLKDALAQAPPAAIPAWSKGP